MDFRGTGNRHGNYLSCDAPVGHHRTPAANLRSFSRQIQVRRCRKKRTSSAIGLPDMSILCKVLPIVATMISVVNIKMIMRDEFRLIISIKRIGNKALRPE